MKPKVVADPQPPHSSAIQGHLLRAFEARGSELTLAELVRLADLDCSPDSLSRKLRGTQALRSQEAEALAKALRVDVSISQPGRSAA